MQPANESFVDSVVGRIRDVIARQSLESLDAFAATLLIAPADFRVLINDRENVIDALFLIDVVAAFVQEFAVDPEWLLTGEYSAATHREALTLAESRTPAGAHLLRQFIRERYERLHGARSYSAPTLSKSSP